jgi:hypothetical protein
LTQKAGGLICGYEDYLKIESTFSQIQEGQDAESPERHGLLDEQNIPRVIII